MLPNTVDYRHTGKGHSFLLSSGKRLNFKCTCVNKRAPCQRACCILSQARSRLIATTTMPYLLSGDAAWNGAPKEMTNLAPGSIISHITLWKNCACAQFTDCDSMRRRLMRSFARISFNPPVRNQAGTCDTFRLVPSFASQPTQEKKKSGARRVVSFLNGALKGQPSAFLISPCPLSHTKASVLHGGVTTIRNF